jgi:hypothetical protein
MIESFTTLHMYKFHPTDKPWITPHIKELIRKHQKVFHSGNDVECKSYRNTIKTEIKNRKKAF